MLNVGGWNLGLGRISIGKGLVVIRSNDGG